MLSVLETKLHRPRLSPDIIPRPRLLDRLDEALGSRRLAHISAPAGYGKSTLAAGWLDRLATRDTRPYYLAWYSLDESDNDLRVFLNYLVIALRRADPAALPETADLLGAVPLPAAVRAADVFSRDAAALPGQAVLVLDDYHAITAPDIHAFIARLARYCPPTLFLVLITRFEPPLPWSQWRARNEMVELLAADLAFNDGETELFLRTVPDSGLTPETAAVLRERTEGWAVGLRLASLSMRDPASRAGFVEGFRANSLNTIFDYLVDEVLANQPPELQDFLVRTSLLDRMNRDLCAALLQREDPAACQATLETLERQNLFILPLDSHREWYRYHHQLQAMLRERLAAVESDDAIRAAHRRAARWLAERDLVEEALIQYKRAGDLAAMAELVESRVTRLENQEAWHTLERYLSLLPEEASTGRPALLLAAAWLAQHRLQRDATWALAERVDKMLAGNDFAGDPAMVAGWQAELHALRASQMFRHLPPAEQAEHSRVALAHLPPEKTALRGYVMLNQLYLARDEASLAACRDLIAREMDGSGRATSIYRTRLLLSRAMVELSHGDLADARLAARELIDLASDLGLVSGRAYGHTALGLASYHANRLPEAVKSLPVVFAHPHQINASALVMAFAPFVDAALAVGHEAPFEEMLAVLGDKATSGSEPILRQEVEAARAYLAMRRGDLAAAVSWADIEAPPAEPLLFVNSPMIRAVIRLAGGDARRWAAARAELSAFIIECDRRFERYKRINATAVLAAIEWQMGLGRPALDHLEAAVAAGYPRGFRRVFVVLGPVMGEMLHALAREGRQAATSGELLAVLAADGDRQAPARPATPSVAPLSERELDILELLAQGLTNKEIAVRLRISPLTVRNHASSLYAKLGAGNRRQAVGRARAAGLIR